MAARLIPCPSCSRHVKLGPPSCPFCGGDVPTDVVPRATSLSLGRPHTRVALALAGAAAVAACSSSSSSTVPVADAGHDATDANVTAFDAAYGVAVIPDAQASDGELTGFDAAYGVAVIPDAGAPDGDVTGFDAAYGVAVIPDAGDAG